MKSCELKALTGKMVKGWWEWLVREQAGCCSVHSVPYVISGLTMSVTIEP